MTQTAFRLERFVHHTLTGHLGECLELLQELPASVPAGMLISELIWPTLECVQQLHLDRSIATRTHNTAVRTLRALVEHLCGQQPPEQHMVNRSLMVLTAPGERDELAAHITASLAEGTGWRTYFAGANLSAEEMMFSIGQLGPDVVLFVSTLRASAASIQQAIALLHRGRVWPRVQIAVCGAAIEQAMDHPPGADIAARDAVEALEVLELCPDYRATAPRGQPASTPPAMHLPTTPEISIAHDAVRHMVATFRGLTQHPN